MAQLGELRHVTKASLQPGDSCLRKQRARRHVTVGGADYIIDAPDRAWFIRKAWALDSDW